MKTKILTFVAILAAAVLSSCNESWDPQVEDGEGQVLLSNMGVDVDLAVNEVISRAESTTKVDLSNFIVTIKNSKGVVRGNWTYSELPEVFTLPVGAYTVEVASRSVQKVEWDAPLYRGSSAFQIVKDKVTDAGVVTCRFASVKVEVVYEGDMRSKLGDDVTVTVVANDEVTVVFDKNETRCAYFEPMEGNTTLVATFEGTVDGYYNKVVEVITDVKAGDFHRLKYKIKDPNPEPPSEVGTVEPGIGVDSSVEKDDVYNPMAPTEDPLTPDERPGEGEDKPDKPDVPPTPSNDININADFPLDEENTVEDGKSYVVTITSNNPIDILKVKIDSQVLPPEELETVGLKDEFDLANPDPSLITGFQSLGFPYGDNVKGQTEVKFELTGLIPLLGVLDPGTSTFILTVKDNQGNEKTQNVVFVKK